MMKLKILLLFNIFLISSGFTDTYRGDQDGKEIWGKPKVQRRKFQRWESEDTSVLCSVEENKAKISEICRFVFQSQTRLGPPETSVCTKQRMIFLDDEAQDKPIEKEIVYCGNSRGENACVAKGPDYKQITVFYHNTAGQCFDPVLLPYELAKPPEQSQSGLVGTIKKVVCVLTRCMCS